MNRMKAETSNKPIVINCQVVVELVSTSGEVERCKFTLVPAAQADYKAGLLGENTALGHSLFGRHAGETIPYRAGDLCQVCILSVALPDGEIQSDAAEKRRAAVQAAANQSEIINQMIFATARGSKWGDYDVDVDHLLENDEKGS
jgi:hypothetical protein